MALCVAKAGSLQAIAVARLVLAELLHAVPHEVQNMCVGTRALPHCVQKTITDERV